MKLFLRAGHEHTGDPGAIAFDGTRESVVNNNVVNLISQKLQNKVQTVISARPYNTQEDYHTAKQKRCNLILFLHCNSATNSTATGAEVYYNHTNFEGYGSSLLNYYSRAMGLNKRSCTLKAAVAAMDYTDIPILLLEMGFLSNYSDLQKLKFQQDYISDSIIHWILGQCPDVREYTFEENSDLYNRNDSSSNFKLLAPVRVINGRTYLPLRDVANLTGKKAGYLPGVKKIILF